MHTVVKIHFTFDVKYMIINPENFISMQHLFDLDIFRIPASLVVPAVIIHQIVHGMQYSMKNHGYAKKFPPRVKALIPVCAALASIFPVVPVVDHTFEFIMEPTLGKYLELEFPEHDKKEH